MKDHAQFLLKYLDFSFNTGMARIAFIILLVISGCLCDHFRGAIMTWKLNSDGHTIDIDNRQSWRRSYPGNFCNETSIAEGDSYSGGSLRFPVYPYNSPFLYQCTDFSIGEDWISGRGRNSFNITYSSTYYEVSFAGCCWISTLVHGHDSSWLVVVKMNTTIRKDTGKMNTSPNVDLAPIQRMQHGCNHTIRLPVLDEDGDKVKCRWANQNETAFGYLQTFPNAILDEDACTIKYSAIYEKGWFAVTIQIEDFNYAISPNALSSVPVQFIVSVQQMNGTNGSCATYERERPKFVNLTLPDKACVGVKNDTDFSTTITIQSGSQTGISELNTVSPLGLVKSSLEHSNLTGHWHINIKWNPNSTDTVNNVFCFTAVDDAGLSSDQRCITLLAGVPPANIIPSSKSPSAAVVPTNQKWWSIDFDQESKAPTKSAYIYLYYANGTLAEQIDVYNSSGVKYTFGANTATLQFSTSGNLEPGQEYYFLFGQGLVQGKSYCGAESAALLDPSFWRFRTQPGPATGGAVRCYEGLNQVPCTETFFNCTENWRFQSPCTRENILAGHMKFPHPSSANKFILCDLTGKTYVAYCPQNEVFHARCSMCSPVGAILSATCVQESITNPCTRQNILAGNLFFAYPGNDTKYIHCDIWGHPWEQECQHGYVWDQTDQTCIVPTTYNPCRQHGALSQSIFPHHCDPHLFVHCDGNGQSFVQACQQDFVFLPSGLTCVPQGFPGSEALANTCH